jgi:hypothetical protein
VWHIVGMNDKLTVDQIKAVLANTSAVEQKSIDLCSAIRAALVKFEGKKITRRMQTAVEQALPGALVFYSPDTFYTKLGVWGGTTGRTCNNRFEVYFGGYQQATFSLATFDEKNACTGSAAVKRNAGREALLARPEALQALVDAVNAQKQAQQAVSAALACVVEAAGTTFSTGELENTIEAFLK